MNVSWTAGSIVINSNTSYAGRALMRDTIVGNQPRTLPTLRKQSRNFTGKILTHHVKSLPLDLARSSGDHKRISQKSNPQTSSGRQVGIWVQACQGQHGFRRGVMSWIRLKAHYFHFSKAPLNAHGRLSSALEATCIDCHVT